MTTSPLGARQATTDPLGESEETAAVAALDWWDPNEEGLSVVGAYRAIATIGSPWTNDPPGVYADTLVNNANPGVNDLVESNGAVPWAANTGWQFVAAAAQALDTSLLNTGGVAYSSMAQVAAVANNGFAFGAVQAGNTRDYRMRPALGAGITYQNGTAVAVGPALLAGNLGMSGLQGYRNGVAEGAPTINGIPVLAVTQLIGARHVGAAVFNHITANIRAVVFYSAALTAPQMLAVATAMSQL